jgi:D-alanyl-D-alanine carboxypeptidase/D-alanyl-D-alanine-endopeptidase (penicillin-binding protein 4)
MYKIDSLFNEKMFEHAHWGVLIKSLDSGDIWYQQNSQKVFMPASNEKIITTSAALLNLGPYYRFETKVYYTGEINDSVLNGDLVVWSNGDPTLYSRFYDYPREVFYGWANFLDSLGIKKITGNIIGNDNAFDDNHLGYGWSFDGLDSWYSAEVGALQLNENYIDFEIIPPPCPEDSVLLIPNLPSSYYQVVNNLKAEEIGRNRITYERKSGENVIYFSGRVRTESKEIELSPSITNPTLFYVTVLKEVFEESGIDVEGDPVEIDSIGEFQDTIPEENILIHHYSNELKEIIRVLMKKSQNLYAETMVRVLGWECEGLGSFRNGKIIVDSTLSAFGVDKESYKFRDGSGLSRYNYVSPEALVKVLEGMYFSEYKDVWMDSFPVGGIDGTLEDRFKDNAAYGIVRAKTGTISNVRGLSGYIKTGEGENLVFSFLLNGHLLRSRDTEIITDTVLGLLADFKYAY